MPEDLNELEQSIRDAALISQWSQDAAARDTALEAQSMFAHARALSEEAARLAGDSSLEIAQRELEALTNRISDLQVSIGHEQEIAEVSLAAYVDLRDNGPKRLAEADRVWRRDREIVRTSEMSLARLKIRKQRHLQAMSRLMGLEESAEPAAGQEPTG